MIQLFPKSISGVGYGGASRRVGVFDGSGSFTENIYRAPMPFDGVVRGFSIYCGVAHASITVTILLDGVSSGVALTLDPGDEQATDAAAEFYYLAGQTIDYQIVTTEGVFPGLSMTMCVGNECEGNAYTVAAQFKGSVGVGHTEYAGALGNGYWAENRAFYSICAIAGSVVRLVLATWVANSGGSWQVQLEVDDGGGPVLQDGTGGTIDTTAILDDADPDGIVIVDFADVALEPGWHCNVVFTRLGSEAVFGFWQLGVGIGFIPAVANQFQCVGGSNDLIPIPGTTWKWNHSEEQGATLLHHQAPIVKYTVRALGLYVEHSNAPGTGEQFTDTVLNTGVATDITVAVADGADDGNVTANAVFRPGDFIAIELVSTSGANAVAKFYWGMAFEIAAPFATLIVQKVVEGGDDTGQTFPITVTEDSGSGVGLLLTDGAEESLELEPGTYAVAETETPGWTFVGIVVDNGDPGDAIVLEDGDTVTAVVTNALATSALQVFKFAPSDPLRAFTILIGPDLSPTSVALRDTESYIYEDIAPGVYSVAEIVPPGWSVEAVVSNGSPLEAIVIAAGETVTVWLTNTLAECECCVATQIALVNQALLKLGHSQTIEALDDSTRESMTSGLVWMTSLRAALRRFPWAFATKYASAVDDIAGYMDLVGGTPTEPYNTDWQYAYRYPVDALFARRLVNPATKQGFDPDPYVWRVGRDDDGWIVYTDIADAVLEYTALVECLDNYSDDLFEDALSWLLASKLAPSLARNKITAAECLQLFEDRIAVAATVNVKERQLDHPGEAEWIRNRE